ncbi:hypothetical protein PHYSODRAFT_492147 [Phytophthora sojae]|uniref:KATNIP domain-containing protein n=1 Tax=Phytophthora sojae (strain P6497) TaxID=1094619 RepID=G4Z3I5_PHYSP|nr:hypothetical protein PHYSODRAFT_492147 [Phytophthora sojae]EGZ19357.1 hypothetical protein PHYSODRAFT_492147 [Phytophthora sojae]|eukprot:XP_009522074.1 hypothetical protein PHYSODRAFT_492147 [Phytophthora sojae]
MAERKRWDKQQQQQQQDLHPSRGDSSSAAEAKADPVLTRQLQYIKVLEERNRVKKRLAAASKRNDRLQEREEAFVTAFNVPARAAGAAQIPSTSSRSTRSTTSVLPTKFSSKREEAKPLSKCRSAPSTTLNFGSAADEEKGPVRRAKWSRPQAPMGVAVEHQDGVPLFRLTTQKEVEEKDGEEEEEDEEESYLEDPVDLSKTTKELVRIIQHLSRTKQRALVDVLHKFQASEQDADDVKVLQSSIGDPAIWKEITSTLNPSTSAPTDAKTTAVEQSVDEVPTNLLEEQLRWEDEYANEMKERLEREREEKQRILKEAEERRAKMMKQLEDEEREIERLMEVKRQERLAKLRALQEEAALSDHGPIHVKLLSTWSKTRVVGLTQICVYDLNGEELPVDVESVQLFDQPTGKSLPRTNDMVRGLQKLFNGVAQTNAEKDMWLGRLGDSGVLLVRFEVSSAPSKLCIWNHNSRTHTACTRDIEVLVSGKCVWTGSLPETFGDPDDSTCTWIDLLGTARKTSRTAPVTSRSTSNLDTWMADEKPSSGNVTSRRRQGKPLHSSLGSDTKPRYEQNGVAPSLASLSSWDSLEKFSKTNRTDIPVLPSGKWLQIEILSTWGDPYYLVKFHDPVRQVTACPESINVLEENSDDPRVPKNLVDGVNFTCDDFHMWLAPFTPGQAHYALLEMNASVSISMVRIWNYNKSRTHTCRGVREIRQAPGLVGADSMEISNEVILFTQETAILEAIEANDEALRTLAGEQQREDEETREIVASVHRSMELQRPHTSDAGSRTVEQNQESDRDDNTTLRTSIDSWVISEEPQQRSPDAMKTSEGVGGGSSSGEVGLDENLPRGRRLTLQLHSTWGDRNYIGLTQLGYVGDPRTIDKLLTCDDTHMWLVPLESGAAPEVRIELKTAQYFYGLRIWNYSKSPEDTYRGVKQLVVALDGVVISPRETGFLLRKAPGVADFDFGQLVRFSEDTGTEDKLPTYSERVHYPFNARAYKTPIVRQDYEAPLYPQGFFLKIICWTTWGDPYYLGLNGLELYDFAGARILDKPPIVTAVPYSVSELDNSSGRQQDTRIPDNLLSGRDKNTWEAHDAWLASLASSLGTQQGNIVYIGFDTPVVLSMIKFWNYSKTPERGVKCVDIYLDDMHLFSGSLRKAPAADVHAASGRFGKVHKVTEQFGQAVLFSASQAQADAEKRSVYYCGVEEQDVLGINEGQVMQESRAMYRKPDPGAEGVVVDLDLRPMTAVCRQ